MEGDAKETFESEFERARDESKASGAWSFEELAAQVLHREVVRPHWLAYEFLATFGELGRGADSSLSVVECCKLLDELRILDGGRRAAYRHLWRTLDAATAEALRLSLKRS